MRVLLDMNLSPAWRPFLEVNAELGSAVKRALKFTGIQVDEGPHLRLNCGASGSGDKAIAICQTQIRPHGLITHIT